MKCATEIGKEELQSSCLKTTVCNSDFPRHQAEHAVDASTGHALGGRMKQDICDDHNGLDAWDQRHGSRCFVSPRNSVQGTAVACSEKLLWPAEVA